MIPENRPESEMKRAALLSDHAPKVIGLVGGDRVYRSASSRAMVLVVELREEAEHALIRLRHGFERPSACHSSLPVECVPTFFRLPDQEMDRAVSGLMNETDWFADFRPLSSRSHICYPGRMSVSAERVNLPFHPSGTEFVPS